MMQVDILPLLKDNYGYVIHTTGSHHVMVVDPSEALPVLDYLRHNSLTLTHILCTHHHGDHIGGNRELKQATGCNIVGYKGDEPRIPGIDHTLADNEEAELNGHRFRVLYIPGHTLGHIAYWFMRGKAVFCGDTLFSLGCGRLFEGTPEQMLHSLNRLAALPDETRMYCGHEYTEANGRFALTLEPGNPALRQRMKEAHVLRADGLPTLPSTIAQEKAANPFLRTYSREIRQILGMKDDSAVEVFAEIRRRKDVFQ